MPALSVEMRVAIFSDIHGNSIALDAVLHDIHARGGVDAYWILGDLAALGVDPVGVLERIYQLPNVTVIRGNTDRYLVTGERPLPTPRALQENFALLPQVLEIAQNFAWTLGAIRYGDWLERLAALPLDARFVLPDGTRVLCVHASPGTDDGSGIEPVMTDDEIRALISGCDADLIFVGHTHWALDRTVDNVRIVNLGSISNPLPPDLGAKYVLLQADAAGHRIAQYSVEYDRETVIALAHQIRHPAAHYIAKFLRGERIPRWQNQ